MYIPSFHPTHVYHRINRTQEKTNRFYLVIKGVNLAVLHTSNTSLFRQLVLTFVMGGNGAHIGESTSRDIVWATRVKLSKQGEIYVSFCNSSHKLSATYSGLLIPTVSRWLWAMNK